MIDNEEAKKLALAKCQELAEAFTRSACAILESSDEVTYYVEGYPVSREVYIAKKKWSKATLEKI